MENCLIFNPFYTNDSYKADISLFSAALGWTAVSALRFMEVANGKKAESKVPTAALFLDKDITLARRLTARGTRLFNSADCIYISDDKSLTHERLDAFKVASPHTIVLPFTYSNIGYGDVDFADSLAEDLKFPLLIKESSSSYGMGVFLIKDIHELKNIIKTKEGTRLIAQEYIKTDFDIRVYVCGGEVIAAYRRIANADFRTNVARGGKIEGYKISEIEKRVAISAAKAVGADFCGVDIIPAEKPYVIEVNSNAHIKNIEKVCGVNAAMCIAEYIKKILR